MLVLRKRHFIPRNTTFVPATMAGRRRAEDVHVMSRPHYAETVNTKETSQSTTRLRKFTRRSFQQERVYPAHHTPVPDVGGQEVGIARPATTAVTGGAAAADAEAFRELRTQWIFNGRVLEADSRARAGGNALVSQ